MTQQATRDRPEWTIGAHTYRAADCRDGVLVDPELPDRFDGTDNDRRPKSHGKFWHLPSS